MPEKKTKIDPERWYTLSEIVEREFFPWCGTTVKSYRKVVLADKKKENLLKTLIGGKSTMTRYRFKGANIIRFIARIETGEVRL